MPRASQGAERVGRGVIETLTPDQGQRAHEEQGRDGPDQHDARQQPAAAPGSAGGQKLGIPASQPLDATQLFEADLDCDKNAIAQRPHRPKTQPGY